VGYHTGIHNRARPNSTDRPSRCASCPRSSLEGGSPEFHTELHVWKVGE
jgi:hypothetical protein